MKVSGLFFHHKTNGKNMSETIKDRYSDAVIFTSETATTIKEAATEAVSADADLARSDLAGADLADANLADANLAGADLADANLAGANLAGANLAGADLARADLARADLAGAYLADANLAGANLAGAYLAGAYLARANLAGAYLAGAYLARANLADADLAGADLAGAYLADANLADADLADAKNIPGNPTTESQPRPEAPVIPKIHTAILEAVTAKGCSLDMSSWHTCETTHCRAGWVVQIAGAKGKALERAIGTGNAARAIYRASDPGCRSPWFYATDEAAMEDIKKCAALETEFGTAAPRPV